MNVEKRRKTKERLEKSNTYTWLLKASDLMDRYYVDAALGFAIPGGIGDALAALISVVYVGFSAFINNSLRDVLLGMIPFYLGDIIDIFHRSNQQNMHLIRGFVEGDQQTIKTVNRKATYSIILFVCLCIMIYFMVKLVIWAGQLIISGLS